MGELEERTISGNFGTLFALENLLSGACILTLALNRGAARPKPIRRRAGEMAANWAKVLADIL
jgi:hypothetical protein